MFPKNIQRNMGHKVKVFKPEYLEKRILDLIAQYRDILVASGRSSLDFDLTDKILLDFGGMRRMFISNLEHDTLGMAQEYESQVMELLRRETEPTFIPKFPFTDASIIRAIRSYLHGNHPFFVKRFQIPLEYRSCLRLKTFLQDLAALATEYVEFCHEQFQNTMLELQQEEAEQERLNQRLLLAKQHAGQAQTILPETQASPTSKLRSCKKRVHFDTELPEEQVRSQVKRLKS